MLSLQNRRSSDQELYCQRRAHYSSPIYNQHIPISVNNSPGIHDIAIPATPNETENIAHIDNVNNTLKPQEMEIPNILDETKHNTHAAEPSMRNQPTN